MMIRSTSIAISALLLLSACSKPEETKKQESVKAQTSPQPEQKSEKKPPEDVQEKKRRFIALMLPAIEEVYIEYETNYKRAERAIKDNSDAAWLDKMKTKYKAQTNEELLEALKPVPKSIVLAQAAKESGWGTSRFFKEANNVFGVWSFNENEPRVAALQKRGDKTVYVKKYNDLDDSIRGYFYTLATGGPYKMFRAEKMKTDNPYELVKYLDKYCELGQEYVKMITTMIRINKFTKYDKVEYTAPAPKTVPKKDTEVAEK